MIVTIIVIMPLDAIRYINYFFAKNSCLLFSILLFIFSSFVFNSPNSARCCNILSSVLLFVSGFWSRRSVIFASSRYVSVSVWRIIYLDCIVTSGVVSLHLPFNIILPIFFIIFSCSCHPSHSITMRCSAAIEYNQVCGWFIAIQNSLEIICFLLQFWWYCSRCMYNCTSHGSFEFTRYILALSVCIYIVSYPLRSYLNHFVLTWDMLAYLCRLRLGYYLFPSR